MGVKLNFLENEEMRKDDGSKPAAEDCIPVVALRGLVVLPGLIIHFDLNRAKSIRAVEEAMMKDQRIFLVTQREVEDDDPGFEDVYHMGCLVKIRQVTKLPENVMRVLVEGVDRGRLAELIQEGDYLSGLVEKVDSPQHPEGYQGDEEALEREEEAMLRNLKEMFMEYAAHFPESENLFFEGWTGGTDSERFWTRSWRICPYLLRKSRKYWRRWNWESAIGWFPESLEKR